MAVVTDKDLGEKASRFKRAKISRGANTRARHYSAESDDDTHLNSDKDLNPKTDSLEDSNILTKKAQTKKSSINRSIKAVSEPIISAKLQEISSPDNLDPLENVVVAEDQMTQLPSTLKDDGFKSPDSISRFFGLLNRGKLNLKNREFKILLVIAQQGGENSFVPISASDFQLKLKQKSASWIPGVLSDLENKRIIVRQRGTSTSKNQYKINFDALHT